MRLLVLSDHALLRAGLAALLEPIASALTEAGTLHEALIAFRRDAPDVVILDITFRGGGLDLLRRLKSEEPSLRVVVVSPHADVVYASAVRRNGALGYLSRTATADQLALAVNRAARRETFVDAATASALAAGTGDGSADLSMREREILSLLADGRGLAEIADTLGLAYKTVANARTRLKEKLGADTTSDLLRFAVENRLGVVGDWDAEEPD